MTPNEWVKSYSKTKAFKLDDAGKLIRVNEHKGWELFGNVQVKKFEEPVRATDAAVKDLIKAGKGDDPVLTASGNIQNKNVLACLR